MAISQRAVGAWAAVNATTQTVTLPTHVAGDMLIVRTIRKPFTNPNDTVINTAGWTAVATGVANGSTANGVGVGSMGFKAFWKVATSAAETNPVVTWGTTADPGAAVAVSYQRGGSESFIAPVGDGGGDATARTSQTSTIASHVSVTNGDLVDFFRGQCDDSGALTVPTITQTSVTYNTVTEYPATALASGTGNDIAADGGYRIATAGTSSAAAVVTGTSAASEQHGAWMTRLRVVATQDTAPNFIDQTATIASPTITPGNVNVTPDLIDQTAATFDASVFLAQAVVVAQITQTAVIDAPTITQPAPAQDIIPGLINQTAAIHAPTVYLGYSATVLTDSPVGYWRLGEPSGTTATDVLGANDGTYVSGTETVVLNQPGALVGDTNKAIYLSGVGPTMAHTTLPGAIDLVDGPLSVEWWQKPTFLSGEHKIFDRVGSNAVQITMTSGKINLNKAGVAAIVASTVTETIDGLWHHFVVTKNGSACQIWRDGVDVTGTVTNQTLVANSGTWIVGRHRSSSVEPFVGYLDEIAVYNTVLSGAQVQAHYAASGYTPYTVQVMADAPVHYWRLGEPSGTVIDFGSLADDGTTTGTVTRDAAGLITAAAGDDGAVSFAASSYVSGTLDAPIGNVFSLEAWVKMPASGTTFLTYFSTTGTQDNLALGIGRGSGQFYVRGYIFDGSSYDAVAATLNLAVEPGGTYHIVWTRAGTNPGNLNKIYVNGVDASASVGTTQAVVNTDTTFYIGGMPDVTETWVDVVDEVAVYSTVLSAARVLAHYQAGGHAHQAAVGQRRHYHQLVSH